MIAEDEKSLLTIVGDRKSLATCRDYQNFDKLCGDVRILHDFPGEIRKKSDDLYWGIKSWEASNGETGTRIFVLSGNNSAGRVFILPGKSGAWVVCPSTGELS